MKNNISEIAETFTHLQNELYAKIASHCNIESEKYSNIIAEPEMNVIKESLQKLGTKYNFRCDILLNDLASNQQLTLYKTEIKGPFVIDVYHENFNFLKDKVFDSFFDIEKEIMMEKLNILANYDTENNLQYNKENNKIIFRCCHCGKFECNKDKNIKNCYNNGIIMGQQIPRCVNCSKLWIDGKNDFDNKIMFLGDSRISKQMLEITNIGGGSISMVHKYAKINKKTN